MLSYFGILRRKFEGGVSKCDKERWEAGSRFCWDMRTLVCSEDLISPTRKFKNPSKFCEIAGQLSFKIVPKSGYDSPSYRTLDVLSAEAGDGGLAMISEI